MVGVLFFTSIIFEVGGGGGHNNKILLRAHLTSSGPDKDVSTMCF